MRFINNEARAVSMLRANESRRYGARWRMKMAFGVTNVLLAIAVVVGSVVFREPLITVGIYGAGLIYSAVLRIASAFKRTDIVYHKIGEKAPILCREPAEKVLFSRVFSNNTFSNS